MRRVLPWLPVPVAVGALALWRPGLLIGGAQSWKGFAVLVGTGLAGVLVLGCFWRRSREQALWLASLVVLALMGVTLWPAFRERTVVEAFPAAELAAAPVATPDATVPPVVAGPASTPVPVPAAVSAVLRSAGRFHGIHHRANGGAALYDLAGRTVLRLEDISFQGTPGPSVHLVHRGGRTRTGGIRLGALKGEHGSFSYRTPVGFRASAGWTVLVWCDTYDVPIAAADLS